MCFKVHKAFFQGQCCVWYEEGLCGVGRWGGGVVDLAIFSDCFFLNIYRTLGLRPFIFINKAKTLHSYSNLIAIIFLQTKLLSA